MYKKIPLHITKNLFRIFPKDLISYGKSYGRSYGKISRVLSKEIYGGKVNKSFIYLLKNLLRVYPRIDR